MGRHLVGLVPTTVFPAARLQACGAPITFASSRHEVQTTYEPIQLDGDDQHIGYLESFGETVLAYVPPAVAARWYAARWQVERSAVSALYTLNCMLCSGGKGLEGSDYIRWIYGHEGEENLLALARAGAPLPVASHLVHFYALASKYYRIPISITLGEEHYLGYGIPGISRAWPAEHAPLQGEPWERMLRLQGWVLFGDEEHGEWPQALDIAAHQSEVQRLYVGHPVNFR